MFAEFEAFLGGLEKKKRRVPASRIVRDLKRVRLGTSPFLRGAIAEDASGVLGFTLFSQGFNGDARRAVLHVSDFFVRQTARRKGVGRRLMQHLHRAARAADCARIELTVWNLNPAALAFYLEQGFTPVDEELLLALKIAK